MTPAIFLGLQIPVSFRGESRLPSAAVLQIVFNEISAAEISQLETLDQLELLDEFRVTEDDLENLEDERFGRMDVAIAKQAAFLQKGLPVLATVGSTAPFVGLFGTVWGIMNAFIEISKFAVKNVMV